jgi:hypothetical protein
MKRNWMMALAALWIGGAACSSSSSAGIEGDDASLGSDEGAGTADLGPISGGEPPDAGGGGGEDDVEQPPTKTGFGEPCQENTDCESGFCVESYKSKVCSQLCTENCPDGWVCAQITNTLPDITFACVPTIKDLCKPCSDAKQCGSVLDLCVAVGPEDTTHCATQCESDAGCPSGFACSPLGNGTYCLPTSQSCTCDATLAGLTRPCVTSNDAGSCSGTETCQGDAGWGDCSAQTPQPETCNGIDDDCNGTADDGLGGTGCTRANDFGVCAGTLECAGPAGLVCSAPEPLPEACNRKDDNCDGNTDDAGALGCTSWFIDGDGDGLGASSTAKCLCAPDATHTVSVGGDCDDADANVGAQGQAEVCTATGNLAQDEDCDGAVDEVGAEGCIPVYPDADGDGFGANVEALCTCNPGQGTSQLTGDCNDSNTDIHPGAQETCNASDDDCDGTTDEEGAIGCSIYYADQDNDTFGTQTASACLCGPAGVLSAGNTDDCDDANNTIYPGAAETCNGEDDDCDEDTDELGAVGCTSYYFDGDSDDFGDDTASVCACLSPSADYAPTGGDCNDLNAAINPASNEACNGTDDDCDGNIDELGATGCADGYADLDGDGYGNPEAPLCACLPFGDGTSVDPSDCDDTSGAVSPEGVETCGGADEDCDGAVDEIGAAGCLGYSLDMDGDGYGVAGDLVCACGPSTPYSALLEGDCDDSSADVGPGGAELCNGADDDCDGTVDEPGAGGCLPYYPDADGDGFGTSAVSACQCAPSADLPLPWPGDCDDADPLTNPSVFEPCTLATDCCVSGSQCIYGWCLAEAPPCNKDSDCQGDTTCDDGKCIPFEIAPEASNPDCVKAPQIGIFNPAIQCSWLGPAAGDAFPTHAQVLGTPMVADFNWDGDPATVQPSVVFVSYSGSDGGFPAASSNGIVRILDGSTCALLHTIGNAKVVGASPLAIGDLDLAPDGRPEIVAYREGGGLVAFRFSPEAGAFALHWVSTNKDGTTSTLASNSQRWNGPTLADVTGDDRPEVLMGTVLHGPDGKVLANNLGYAALTGTETGNFDVVADIDLDGAPELITSKAVYRYDPVAAGGSWVVESWWKGSANPNHFIAVGDLGNFPVAGLPSAIPEIVMVGEGTARVLRADGTVVFGPYTLPTFTPGNPGYGGPPTIGDFDGDGQAEFAAAGYGAYTVFDLSCVGTIPPLGCQSAGVLWTRQSQDASSNRTGSSVFDFEADGVAEAVYADECYTRVYDGLSGEVLFSQSRTSCTWYENPVIADVDGDLRSEIVVGSNTNCGTSCSALDPIHRGLRCTSDDDCPGENGDCVVGYCRCASDAECGAASGYKCVPPIANTPGKGNVCRAAHQGPRSGILVYRDFADGWVNSRPIWNQHAYTITDVSTTGQVTPRSSITPNWLVPTLNNFRQNAQGEGDPTLATDITLDPGVLYNCDSSGQIVATVEVCNRGAAPVDQGVPVAFFWGNPEAGGDILCLESTQAALAPEACEVVSCPFEPLAEPSDLWVFGDFGGTQGKATECLEENNFAIFPDVSCTNLE